jgi:hypothetical protein
MAVVSLVLFWPMIEMGVAMVAACLPTLRPLFYGVSLESIINSVRSMISLQSIRSGSGKHSASYARNTRGQTSSNDSIAVITQTNGSDRNDEWMEIHTMGDVTSNRDDYSPPGEGKIGVRKEVEQSVETV